jgi:hypothetical protein
VSLDEKLNIEFLPLTTTYMFVPRFCGSLDIHPSDGWACTEKCGEIVYIHIFIYMNIHVYIYIYVQ